MKIELDTQLDLLVLDGRRISLEALRMLANPDPLEYYRFTHRHDGSITIEVFHLPPKRGTPAI